LKVDYLILDPSFLVNTRKLVEIKQLEKDIQLHNSSSVRAKTKIPTGSGGTTSSTSKYSSSQKPQVVLPSVFRIAKELQEGKKINPQERKELENTISGWMASSPSKKTLSAKMRKIRQNRELGDFFRGRKVTYADEYKLDREKIGENSQNIEKILKMFRKAGKSFVEVLQSAYEFSRKGSKACIVTCSPMLARMAKKLKIVILGFGATAYSVRLYAFTIDQPVLNFLREIFPNAPPQLIDMMIQNEVTIIMGVTAFMATRSYHSLAREIRNVRKKVLDRGKKNGSLLGYSADDYRKFGPNPGG